MTIPELSPLRPQQSGVFLVPRTPATLRKVAQRTGCAWLEVDLHSARDKAGFLAACARDLGFPAHFGGNWDAFADCINDFSWQAAPGYVIAFTNFELLAQHAAAEAATAIEILRAAADAWRQRHRTFVVLLDYAPRAVAIEAFPEGPLA